MTEKNTLSSDFLRLERLAGSQPVIEHVSGNVYEKAEGAIVFQQTKAILLTAVLIFLVLPGFYAANELFSNGLNSLIPDLVVFGTAVNGLQVAVSGATDVFLSLHELIRTVARASLFLSFYLTPILSIMLMACVDNKIENQIVNREAGL